jgi:hypothetical protein
MIGARRELRRYQEVWLLPGVQRHTVASTASSPNGATGKLYIAATDHRPDRAGDGGMLWSNTVIVSGGM